MSEITTRPFDPARYLDSTAAMAAYLTEALETGDPAFVADALGVVARARGVSMVAREAGISSESLFQSLSADGNPEFGTVMKVAQALGLRFSVDVAPHRAA